jgi:branched-chain amino acid transport system substrate-binding protein
MREAEMSRNISRLKEGKKMKGKGILFVCLLGIFFMASPSRMEGAEKILKIGLVVPLSGAAAPWGLSWQKTVELQAEEYNAAGGIEVGGEKYKIEIISGDDKYVPSEAVNVTNRLIFKENVKFILGSNCSACMIATRPITEGNKILTLIDGYSSKLLGPDKPFTFRTVSTIGEIDPPMLKWIRKNYPNLVKVGLLAPNDETGWANLAEYKGVGKPLGYEFLVEEYFERNTADYYPVLTRILSKKPDLLMIDAATGDLGLILKQAKQMGFKGLTLTAAIQDGERLCKAAGEQGAEGHISGTPFVSPGKIQEWRDAYFARWKEWDTASIVPFEGLDLLVAGIKKANSLDTEKVRIGIETVDFVSRFYGPVKLGGKVRYGIAHQLIKPVPISQIRKCQNVGLIWAPSEEPPPAPAR